MRRSIPAPGPLSIKFAVSLSDGSCESHVVVPKPTTKEQQQDAVGRWMELMLSAFRMNISSIDATLEADHADR